MFKGMSTAKGNRGIFQHRRFIARIRAGNALFNNDEHHDSHEFLSWLIDEINMNIIEDYKFYIAKKLKTKEYTKEAGKTYKGQMLKYSDMNKDDLDTLIQDKIMKHFKTWVQLMFEGQLVSITKC